MAGKEGITEMRMERARKLGDGDQSRLAGEGKNITVPCGPPSSNLDN